MSFDQPAPDFSGTYLVATPGLADAAFRGAVVLVCAHSADGAMGIVVNALADDDLLAGRAAADHSPTILHDLAGSRRLHVGGPAEPSRPFLLHSTDWSDGAATLRIDDAHALTATPRALAAMAAGDGPDQALVALGYAGWGPGQIEDEIRANAWLAVPASPRVTFELPVGDRWRVAAASIGVSPAALSATVGHA